MLRIRWCLYHTAPPSPLGRVFPSSIDSTTKRVPTPNGMSSESSRRAVSNADFFPRRHYSNCGDIEHGKSVQGCVMIHRPSCTVPLSYGSTQFPGAAQGWHSSSARCCRGDAVELADFWGCLFPPLALQILREYTDFILRRLVQCTNRAPFSPRGHDAQDHTTR